MGRLVHLANLPLRLVRPKFRENITEAVFKTIPSVTKIEIRAFLQKVYGLEIASLETLNYEGEKKRKGATTYFYREPDWKKVYNIFPQASSLAHLPSLKG
ncbi:mitochondrial ribosomal protein L23 precursor [Klebsormidium nitens]|uniref:Large ribosomal subunit protein uL23m n=1 Tax=Klebsormidium nitens TaxID=105231 RepID=A0A1Y1ICD0_KLENI|nr:mitochondrial ribosomal protein L23 precursor [Klebsormidium nitens]|eukprot:GAQ87089.1 mitochondrial ribosomal protein L23 precursor [Klebsormidium nitens]